MTLADSATCLQIREACDDLYCDPDDPALTSRLLQLLASTSASSSVDDAGPPCAVVPRTSWRRLVKIACDELHDDPADADARDRLLLLLAAGDIKWTSMSCGTTPGGGQGEQSQRLFAHTNTHHT
ncbi:hypothetical protein HG717_32145 [Rhodococcus erythropolis]|uniref:hypothetical protein n=1 Tax=Rhodococcus erythropolis TaxID=1833 RepID=UPI001C9A4BFF|nr:hypothetical protein [Rhodococcus erythropolis]MBY6388535.1 hypothetical protein [Rhodococcus erythropolis]